MALKPYLVGRFDGVQYVVNCTHGQHGEPGLLGQHGRGGHDDGGRQACPLADGAALGDAARQPVQIAGARAQAEGGEHGAHRGAQPVRLAVAARVAADDAAPRVGRPVAVPHVGHVAQERGQVEQAGQQVGAAHDAGHGLRVHGVHGERGGGHGGPAPGQ